MKLKMPMKYYHIEVESKRPSMQPINTLEDYSLSNGECTLLPKNPTEP